jgi:hypothetical protein
MSIPDTKEKKIWFTPLVRLSQRIVDKVPPEYRIKQWLTPLSLTTLKENDTYNLFNTSTTILLMMMELPKQAICLQLQVQVWLYLST